MTADSAPPYPHATRGSVVETLHGVEIPDPYRWLEDASAPETKAWLEAQDKLFTSRAAEWTTRPEFAERLGELHGTGVVGPPAWRGERRFFMRREPGQEHAVLLTVDPSGEERVLFDPMALDPSGTTTLEGWQPSKEGDRLAYRISTGGTEDTTLHVVDVDTGEEIDEPIDRIRSSPIAWLPGGEAFFYVRRLHPSLVPEDERQYHRRLHLHRIGTPADDDPVVFGEGRDKTAFYGASVSRDGNWLIVAMNLGTKREGDIWIASLADSPAEAPDFRPVQVGVDAQTHPWVGRDGRLYVWTDLDAPRGRVCTTSPRTPAPEHWETLIPQDSEAVLSDIAILDGDDLDAPVLLVARTRHAVSELSVHALATGERLAEVSLPGLGSLGGLAERPEGGHESWFAYADFTTPSTIFRYDAVARTCEVWATPPGRVEPRVEVEARQETFESADGTTVRMFVLSQAGPVEGAPAILTGYGGFTISLTPTYSANALAWVERGGVYAVASLRGGGEEGEEWHRAGMRESKQKVFEDFEAAADALVASGLTTRDRLVLSGGSNGGLLVGAALTRRPDAYRAVVCSAPLLDMLRYEHSGLGRLWTDEFGTVEESSEFAWLRAYSPYHRIAEGTAYPSVLFTVFDGDSRVDGMHARKMAAALQYATSSDVSRAPILFRNEREVGHGQRAVSRTVGLAADTLAYAAWAARA